MSCARTHARHEDPHALSGDGEPRARRSREQLADEGVGGRTARACLVFDLYGDAVVGTSRPRTEEHEARSDGAT